MKDFLASTDVQVLVIPVSSAQPSRFFLPAGRIYGIAVTTAACTGSPNAVTAHVSTHADPVLLSRLDGAITELPMPSEQVSHIERVVRALELDGVVVSVEVECTGGNAATWTGSVTLQYQHGR